MAESAVIAAIRTGRLWRLGNAAVAFLPFEQKLLSLNPTAAYLWIRLAAGADPDVCARELRDNLMVPVASADDYVASFLGELRNAIDAEEPDFDLHLLPAQERRDFETVAAAYFQLGNRVVRAAFARKADYEAVARALAHLAVPARPADHVIDVVTGMEDGRIILDGAHGLPCPSPAGVLPGLASVLFSLWYRASADFLAVHAGLVAFRGRTVLVPGQSGSGKSTATAALLSLGAVYMSDDVVNLARGSLAASGFPFPLTIKADNAPRLAALFPDLAAQRDSIRVDGKRLRYITPARVARRGEEVGAGRPVDAIVFPRYRANAETAVEQLAPADALARLASEWVRVATLDESDVSGLLDWLGHVRTVQLTYGSPAALTRALDRLFDGG